MALITMMMLNLNLKIMRWENFVASAVPIVSYNLSGFKPHGAAMR